MTTPVTPSRLSEMSPRTLMERRNPSELGYRIRISGQRLIICTAMIVFPTLLVWALQAVISRNFSYSPWWQFSPSGNVFVLVAAIFLAWLPSTFMPIRGLRPSYGITWILYLLAYVPSQVVPVFASGRGADSYLAYQLAIFLGLVIIIVAGALPPVRVPTVNVAPVIFWAGVCGYSLLIYLLVIQRYGVPTGVPALSDVYSVRAEFGEESAGQSLFLAYGLSWQYKIVNPLFMAFGLTNKSPLLFFTGLMGQILLYAYTGHKSIVFSALLVFALYFLTRWYGKRLGVGFAIGACTVVLASVAFDVVFDSIWGTSLFVRRLILVPGLLSGFYQDFFSHNEHTFVFGPFLRWLTDYPYEIGVPYLIAATYMDSPDTSANANLWADGFASFGYVGVVFYSIILGGIVWLFNSLGRRKDMVIALTIAGVASFSWVNSSLMTSIATHGIAFALLILVLIPPDERDGHRRDHTDKDSVSVRARH